MPSAPAAAAIRSADPTPAPARPRRHTDARRRRRGCPAAPTSGPAEQAVSSTPASAPAAAAAPATIAFTVDGRAVEVPDDGDTLLGALRDRLGIETVLDGCSPQGQCGCCTVLVDDAPRVACVTPVRRIAGRHVTTAAGLSADERERWADAFLACGATQCGFCTPGIVCRLVGHERRGADLSDRTTVDKALSAHLCRCTGWQTIREAATQATAPAAERSHSDPEPGPKAEGRHAAPSNAIEVTAPTRRRDPRGRCPTRQHRNRQPPAIGASQRAGPVRLRRRRRTPPARSPPSSAPTATG